GFFVPLDRSLPTPAQAGRRLEPGLFTVDYVAAAFISLTAPASAQESTLPGGASSLQEAYQDWNLNCQGSPKIVCVVSQQQSQQNGQRVLAVELRKGEGDVVSGNLVLPFGLQLDSGATLQIDDGQAGEPMRFSTCVPGGCLVPLNFDAQAVAELRAGTVLKIKVKSADQKDLTLPVSLKGLAAALDRLQVLAGG
ncbi:invasion associated locus B family protein, partial [Mesorhizobium sp. M0488]